MSEKNERITKCPNHLGTLVTPTETLCHAHVSNMQQRFHNMHCRLIGCPRALKGIERYASVQVNEPRNFTEKILRFFDWG